MGPLLCEMESQLMEFYSFSLYLFSFAVRVLHHIWYVRGSNSSLLWSEINLNIYISVFLVRKPCTGRHTPPLKSKSKQETKALLRVSERVVKLGHGIDPPLIEFEEYSWDFEWHALGESILCSVTVIAIRVWLWER